MTQRVFRYTVPVNDAWHGVRLDPNREILHVAARSADIVELWAIADDEIRSPQITRRFRVYGTGQPITVDPAVPSATSYRLTHRGTIIPADFPSLVWHLFEDCR